MKDGSYWLDKLQGSLVKVAEYMALNRYGAAPDADDRVSDALAALVEGSARFQPQPGKDGIGYYLQYTLSYVAGALRNGAQLAKDWSDEAACFTDIAPEQLGIERLWETIPDESGEDDEPLFVLNNHKVAGTAEIVGLIVDHPDRRRIAAKVLGVQAADPDLAEQLEAALDAIADQLRAEPRWIEDRPGPAPVVTHDLEPITVIRNGVQSTISAAEMRQQVEDASRKAAVWDPEQLDAPFENDVLWGSQVEAEQDRAYRSAYADDSAWPKSITRDFWDILVGAWGQAGWAQDVLDALIGGETEIAEETQLVIDVMEVLSDAVADEPDGSVRTVARALANRVLKDGLAVKTEAGQAPYEALAETFGWYLGVDVTYGWSATLATAKGMESAVTGWVGKVTALRGVWKSQAAAVTALVLHDASPGESRRAARAAFAGA